MVEDIIRMFVLFVLCILYLFEVERIYICMCFDFVVDGIGGV